MTWQYTIYLDMDDVLTDFSGCLAQTMNDYYKVVKYAERKCIDLPFKKLILEARESVGNRKFVRNDMIYDLATLEVHKFSKWFLTNNECFWINLSSFFRIHKLFKFAQHEFLGCYFLTSPTDEASKIGKMKWLQKTFEYIESSALATKVIFEKDKWKYAKDDTILIDDSIKNVNLFKEHGGIAIQHKNISKTIRNLKEILYK